MEAEHKVRLATLEKEQLDATDAIKRGRREVQRVNAEVNRHRTQAAGACPRGSSAGSARSAGATGRAAGFPGLASAARRPPRSPGLPSARAAGAGRPAGARPGPPPSEPRGGPSADQKLDAILSKLEQMETRLRRLKAPTGGNGWQACPPGGLARSPPAECDAWCGGRAVVRSRPAALRVRRCRGKKPASPSIPIAMPLLLLAAAGLLGLATSGQAPTGPQDRPAKWQYAELSYRRIPAQSGGRTADGAEVPPRPAAEAIRWVTADGEVEATGSADWRAG